MELDMKAYGKTIYSTVKELKLGMMDRNMKGTM